MGDRVSFGGLNVGRQGFPFLIRPPISETTGDGTIYPVSFTREEAVLLFWRTKALRCSFTDVFFEFRRFNGIGSGISTTTLTASGDVDLPLIFENPPVLAATTELKLCTSIGISSESGILSGPIVTVSPPSPPGTPSGQVTITIDIAGPWLVVAGLIYPPINIFSTIQAQGIGVAAAEFNNLIPAIGPNEELITRPITILGKTFNIYATRSDVGLEPAQLPEYDSVAFDIDISGGEYWPYADNDGSPMYDTTTGAALISSF